MLPTLDKTTIYVRQARSYQSSVFLRGAFDGSYYRKNIVYPPPQTRPASSIRGFQYPGSEKSSWIIQDPDPG